MGEVAGRTAMHPRHDPVLIAATVDRRRGPMSALADALVTACAECARLRADLLALAAALPSAATPRRTRDFTLSAADARRLRRGGVRDWLRRIGSGRDTITRPLALGLTTLGLAGLLVATVPTVLPLGAAGAGAAASPTEIERPIETPPDGGFHIQAAPPGEMAPLPRPAPVPADGPSALAALSSSFLAMGLGLFVARRLAPRVARRGSMR